MQQTQAFNFTEQPKDSDLEFKKQRALYLAERNARKQQAQLLLRKERPHSSSSDDEPRLKPPQPATKYAQQAEDSKTNSSQHSSPKPQVDHFKMEREKYKAERTAYRLEMAKNKRKEFGSSSSEDESVPAYTSHKLVGNEAPNKQEALRRSSKEEFGSNPFCSLNLGESLKSRQNQLHPSAKLKAVPVEKRRSYKERYQVQIPSKKGVNIWLQQFLQIKQTSIELAERNIPIYDLNKIKLFFTRTQTGCYKLKITHKDEDLHFAVNHKHINELCLDHYYYLFARIVTLKLQLMGKKVNAQTRPKLGLSEQQLKGAQITGRVRKSSFFGGWEEKIGVVNQSGLCIYKEGKEKPVMMVACNSISQLWTRFDFDNENLIIKFLHNRNKVELSIPYENYLGHDNWLYHIYNLAIK